MPENTQQKNASDLNSETGLLKQFTEQIPSEPIPKEENPKQSIYWAIVHALQHCETIAKTERSRELSLVITKLEEAQMWYEKIYPA